MKRMDDKDILRLFLRRVEELRETTLVREGYKSGFTLKWSKDTGILSMEPNQPNEELFKSLLLSLRHFWLKKEVTYIYNIYSICHQIIKNEEHRQFLAESRKILDKSLKSTGLHLSINNKHFSPEYVWNIYINGIYFHNDTEYMRLIDNLDEQTRVMVKNELYGYVNSSLKQILYAGGIVANAFQCNEI